MASAPLSENKERNSFVLGEKKLASQGREHLGVSSGSTLRPKLGFVYKQAASRNQVEPKRLPGVWRAFPSRVDKLQANCI